jgi:hypothetical protein
MSWNVQWNSLGGHELDSTGAPYSKLSFEYGNKVWSHKVRDIWGQLHEDAALEFITYFSCFLFPNIRKLRGHKELRTCIVTYIYIAVLFCFFKTNCPSNRKYMDNLQVPRQAEFTEQVFCSWPKWKWAPRHFDARNVIPVICRKGAGVQTLV